MERMGFHYERPKVGDMILWDDIEGGCVERLCQVQQWLNDWQMLVWECQREKYNVVDLELDDTILTLVPYNFADKLIEDLSASSSVEE